MNTNDQPSQVVERPPFNPPKQQGSNMKMIPTTEKMITADRARMIAGPSVIEYVEEACAIIQENAGKGLHRAVLRGEFWEHGGYNETGQYKVAKHKLEALGFTVKFIYQEQQFVNMYTEVCW